MIRGINPGRLNKRVSIMRYSKAEDALGNTVHALEEIKKTWAEIRALRGGERLEYYKIENQQFYKITMRNTDITEKDVIKYKDRQFQIQSIVNPLEANYYLECMCIEKSDSKKEEK